MHGAAKAILCALLFALTGCASHAPVHGDIHFECFWWSPRQIDGLDPNHPPPKMTRLTIAKWEYSDPIGVPHPATVEVVLRVSRPLARDPKLTVAWIGDRPRQEIRPMRDRGGDYVASIDTSDTAMPGYTKIVVFAIIDGGRRISATLPIIISD